MHSIDRVGYGEYLLDPARKIPDAHLKSVCQICCGAKACRYISLTGQGFTCIKNSPLKEKFDLMVEMAKQGHVKFSGRGDNCDGFGQHDSRAAAEHSGESKGSRNAKTAKEGLQTEDALEKTEPPEA